jgi:hypothetical protein
VDNPTDITQLLVLIITVIIAPFVPLALLLARRWINRYISAADQQLIYDSVKRGVLAAEQMGLGGDEAMTYALNITESILRSNGLTADLPYLRELAEAEVFEQFNRWKSLDATLKSGQSAR